MPVLNPSQFIYYLGPQSAQGTAAADAALVAAPAVVGGNVSMALDAGVERWPTYGGRFYSAVRFVNSLQGEGELQCAAQPSTVGRILKWFLGGTDTISGAGPYTHTLATGAASQWMTIKRIVGVDEGSGAGGPRFEKYVDSRFTQLVIEGSSANKMVRCTPTFMVADPGVIADVTTPAAVVPAERPWVYTDGTGAFKFSTNSGTATVNTDTISFNLTMAETVNRAEGDGIVPKGFIVANSTCTWAIECTAATTALQEYNKLIYGHHPLVPGAGEKPVATLPSPGSVDILLSYGSGAALRSLQLVSSQVQFTPTGELATNTDGTAATITFTGESTGTTLIAPIVKTGDNAAYA